MLYVLLGTALAAYGVVVGGLYVFQRQLRLYSVGRFRMLAPDGKVVAEGKATPLFSDN